MLSVTRGTLSLSLSLTMLLFVLCENGVEEKAKGRLVWLLGVDLRWWRSLEWLPNGNLVMDEVKVLLKSCWTFNGGWMITELGCVARI